MNSPWIFPILGIAGGGLGALIRYGQIQTGLDPETGLMVPGNIFGYLLLALLVALGVVIWMMTRISKRIPQKPTFSAAFDPTKPALYMMVGGIFATFLSGIFLAHDAFGVSQLDLMMGLLVAMGSVGLLSVLRAFKKFNPSEADGTLLLISVFAAVLLLIVSYRSVSINPVIWVYAFEILALSAVLLSLFQVCAFAFGVGNIDLFYRSSIAAVALCIITLADGHSLAYSLYFAGNALLLGGFLIASTFKYDL